MALSPEEDNQEFDLSAAEYWFRKKEEDHEIVDEVKEQLILSALVGLIKWQSQHYVSDAAFEELIQIFNSITKNIKDAERFQRNYEFPANFNGIDKFLNLSKDFDTIAACPTCHKLHQSKDCFTRGNDGEIKPATCTYVEYPNHPQKTRRKPCGQDLVKNISCVGNKITVVPQKVYAYRSFKNSFQNLMKRENFEKMLLAPKKMGKTGIMQDFYDGEIWKNFKDKNGRYFFNDCRNIGLMLNVDWFNPYRNGEYSLGVIYVVIINLPRTERNKIENSIVIGIIPGPKEPSLNINTYLKPFVEELESIWNDGFIVSRNDGTEVFFKAALVAISSDIPATRKCCGFVGHMALQGCSRSWKKFPRESFNSKPDYSGTSEERPRNGERMKILTNEFLKINTKTEKQQKESKYGIRFSELHKLSYFDPVRMHAVDAMHNLFLGTSKHFFMTLLAAGILTEEKLEQLEELQKKINIPYHLGRVSSSVGKVFKSMKADEWKNWTMIYSVFCFKTLLPKENLENWIKFVQAVWLICRRSVSLEDVEKAHLHLIEFCDGFERLYGKERYTPNMHLHQHLKECIKDFGPVYAFWCFSFERMNGILGKNHLNNHNISATIMNKFSRAMQIQSMKTFVDSKSTNIVQGIKFMTKPKSKILTADENEKITSLLIQLFDGEFFKVVDFCDSYSSISVDGEQYSTTEYRNGKSHYSNILVACEDPTSEFRQPAILHKIFYVTAIIKRNGQHIKEKVLLGYCSIRKKHFYHDYYSINTLTKLYSTELYSPKFINVNEFKGTYTTVKEEIKFNRFQCDECVTVMPLPLKSIE